MELPSLTSLNPGKSTVKRGKNKKNLDQLGSHLQGGRVSMMGLPMVVHACPKLAVNNPAIANGVKPNKHIMRVLLVTQEAHAARQPQDAVKCKAETWLIPSTLKWKPSKLLLSLEMQLVTPATSSLGCEGGLLGCLGMQCMFLLHCRRRKKARMRNFTKPVSVESLTALR